MKQKNSLAWPLAVVCAITVAVKPFAFAGDTLEKYYALPLGKSTGKGRNHKVLDQYGVPFIKGSLSFSTNAPAQVMVGGQADRIFLLGMTESTFIGCWNDPLDFSRRFFTGDALGQIQLNYADGSTEVFPLILGENIWWGQAFYRSPGPFATDATFRQALAADLRLYPPTPVQDGNYVAVITPRPAPLQSITFSCVAAKWGTPVIAGITIAAAETNEIAGAAVVTPGIFPPEFKKFVKEKSLRPSGVGEKRAARRINDLQSALYSSDETFFDGDVAAQTPPAYAGPEVAFKGGRYARIMQNAFAFNVQDIADKIEGDGKYNTSTKGALLWGYNGGQFGTFVTNAGCYYGASWSRDMGRSLQELTELGCTNATALCADYCLRTSRLWENPVLEVNGVMFPPHWSRVTNRPDKKGPYENDGHGLITMFLYKLWQRMPDHDDWLRSRWPDVKAAGDWILWQFAHPEISGATNGVLHTTGECAGGNGYSVYADYVCRDALQALAQMADSIGETQSARAWRDRAGQMREAMASQYIINDPKYGRVWTLEHAGWPDKPTVLGPLIFTADNQGFAPEDDDPALRTVNEAAYQRLTDTYKPFGFYGWAMGYGQGFVTESALLLDRMHDATEMFHWIAKEIYDPRFGSFVVPEGVQLDPTGRFWYRAGDLGNGVQEAEIIKSLRLVIGVDDTQPNRLQFFPRMPYDWKEIAVKKYPVLFEPSGKLQTAHLRYELERTAGGMDLEITADQDLGPVAMRLGPFEKQPGASSVRLNGKVQTITTEHSGDSWWVRFTMPVGPALR